MAPVLQQAGGRLRDAYATALSPAVHSFAHLIDELVFLDALLSPLRIEDQLGLSSRFRLGDWNEVGTDTSPLDNFVGNAFIRKAEMPFRLLERGVDDGVLYNDLGYWSASAANPG